MIIDTQKARNNIAAMCARAKAAQAVFRPHFKTHQSAAVGEWFREVGVSKITVSSLDMATYFAQSGWDDITVAFPVNPGQMELIHKLARKIKLGLLVDNSITAEILERQLRASVDVWVKIDTGYGRSGIIWDKTKQIIDLIDYIRGTTKLHFTGLLTHSGQTYNENCQGGIRHIHQQTISRLLEIRTRIKERPSDTSKQAILISIGDTPSCCVAESLADADEIRPGNFVFFDLMQLLIGSCRASDIAVGVACPVVGKYDRRQEIVIAGGAVHLSKESVIDKEGRAIFGSLAAAGQNRFELVEPWITVRSLSQEHGVISMPEKHFHKINIGDNLLVVPVHSCLTGNLYRNYVTLAGERLGRLSSVDAT